MYKICAFKKITKKICNYGLRFKLSIPYFKFANVFNNAAFKIPANTTSPCLTLLACFSWRLSSTYLRCPPTDWPMGDPFVGSVTYSRELERQEDPHLRGDV